MHGNPKHLLLAQFARVGKALSSPARLELLDLLAQGEKTVDTLARQTGRSITNTSNHLKELRTAALVDSRREGVRIHYRLTSTRVHALVRSLQEVAHAQLAEIDRIVDDYFAACDALEPLSGRELNERMQAGDIVVVDVRPDDEYRAGHIPGALCIPPAQFEARIGELPIDHEIVAYCRGRYCVYARDAVALLRRRGHRARRLDIGIPEWRAMGFDVAVGTEPPG